MKEISELGFFNNINTDKLNSEDVTDTEQIMRIIFEELNIKENNTE